MLSVKFILQIAAKEWIWRCKYLFVISPDFRSPFPEEACYSFQEWMRYIPCLSQVVTLTRQMWPWIALLSNFHGSKDQSLRQNVYKCWSSRFLQFYCRQRPWLWVQVPGATRLTRANITNTHQIITVSFQTLGKTWQSYSSNWTYSLVDLGWQAGLPLQLH